MKYPEHLRRKDEEESDTYAVMTKSLKDRKKAAGQKLMSLAHDAYHFKYSGLKELEELRKKYPVGGEYHGSEIVGTGILNSKTMGG